MEPSSPSSKVDPARIFDGHNDTLLHLALPDRGNGRSLFEQSDFGHIDLPRARTGGLGGGFFAIFVPPEEPPEKYANMLDVGYDVPLSPPVDGEHAYEFTHEVIRVMRRTETESEGQFRVVTTAAELEQSFVEDGLTAVLHFEGADAFGDDLSRLDEFYDLGLRSLGITWSRPNAYAEGVPFRFPASPDTGPGLTALGKDLVRACDDRGVLLDLAHLNLRGFWDVAEITTNPLVATHCGAFALSRSTRNLMDDQLDAIGESGGVVGINFACGFLRDDGEFGSDTPMQLIADHVKYVADRIGIDHVALGSDFDGAIIPDDLGDAAGLPHLIERIVDHGFASDEVRKITHENWFRVLRRVWEGA